MVESKKWLKVLQAFLRLMEQSWCPSTDYPLIHETMARTLLLLGDSLRYDRKMIR